MTYTLEYKQRGQGWQVFSTDLTSRREAEEIGRSLQGAPRWKVYETEASVDYRETTGQGR